MSTQWYVNVPRSDLQKAWGIASEYGPHIYSSGGILHMYPDGLCDDPDDRPVWDGPLISWEQWKIRLRMFPETTVLQCSGGCREISVEEFIELVESRHERWGDPVEVVDSSDRFWQRVDMDGYLLQAGAWT